MLLVCEHVAALKLAEELNKFKICSFNCRVAWPSLRGFVSKLQTVN